jgi:lipid-binding SYLF domain-containing protein
MYCKLSAVFLMGTDMPFGLQCFCEHPWSGITVNGSVALVDMGTGGSIDPNNFKDPIIGFVFGNKGLMYNLTLEGSKYTKIVR